MNEGIFDFRFAICDLGIGCIGDTSLAEIANFKSQTVYE